MIKNCPVCGTSFVANSGKKYCSKECSYEATKERAREAHRRKEGGLPVKSCPTCGKKYHPNHRKQTYCSQMCNPVPMTLQNRACKWCGTLFMPTSKTERFCCKDCEDMYNKSKEQTKKYDPDRVRKKRVETAKIVAKARKQGVSYGEFSTKMM